MRGTAALPACPTVRGYPLTESLLPCTSAGKMNSYTSASSATRRNNTASNYKTMKYGPNKTRARAPDSSALLDVGFAKPASRLPHREVGASTTIKRRPAPSSDRPVPSSDRAEPISESRWSTISEFLSVYELPATPLHAHAYTTPQ